MSDRRGLSGDARCPHLTSPTGRRYGLAAARHRQGLGGGGAKRNPGPLRPGVLQCATAVAADASAARAAGAAAWDRRSRTGESCSQQLTHTVRIGHGSPPFQWTQRQHAAVRVMPSRRERASGVTAGRGGQRLAS